MGNSFLDRIKRFEPFPPKLEALQTLQLNLGNLCNQNCRHCHINASSTGNRLMTLRVMEKVAAFLEKHAVLALDITGGCPEMHPHFRYIIEKTDHLPLRRVVRTNLTVLVEPAMSWLPQFFKDHRLVVCGSLPCYQEENVDRQRGDGTFQKSICALRLLNDAGYGTSMELNLVYNPSGEFLPPPQKELEAVYKREMHSRYSITFNNLYTITNAPVGRFKQMLDAGGKYQSYIRLLQSSFNPVAFSGIMCRSLLSVDAEGFLYNCDFNQAAGLPLENGNGRKLVIDDLLKVDAVETEILVGQHCYSCTAGAGSSCTGALQQ